MDNVTNVAVSPQSQRTELEKLESQMLDNIEKERRLWVVTFTLMKKVQDDELYRAAGYKSFSAWVNAFAIKAKLHVSLLWKRFKAGQYYLAFEQRARDKGSDVVEIDKLDIGAETLVLIEKIAGSNDDVADDLTRKALAGEMKQTDIKEAYAAVKAERIIEHEKKAGTSPTKETKEVELEKKGQTTFWDTSGTNTNPSDDTESKVTAKDICRALDGGRWLKGISCRGDGVYGQYLELPIDTADTRHARRIDVLAIENYTLDTHERHDVCIHVIEIKVARSDLNNDSKMAEYVNNGDRFWLAVPCDLVEDAKAYIADGWGILTYNDGDGIRIVTEARFTQGILRDKTLATVWLRERGD